MKKWLVRLVMGGVLFLPVQTVFAAEVKADGALLSEAMSLHQNAHAVIVQAGQAMEEPFQASFDPQLCLEKAKDLHAFLEKNKAMIPAALLQVLEKEETMLNMAMDYFKILGTVRPSLNALALSQKQYNATKIKEDFAVARAALEELIRVL